MIDRLQRDTAWLWSLASVTVRELAVRREAG